MRKLILGFFAISCVGLLGCTVEKIESAAIRINLPKSVPKSNNTLSSKISASAAGDLMLSHAIINVSGPGIVEPVFVSWDGHRNGTLVAPPSSFVVDVPNGDGRLFQALLVFKDVTTGGEEFYYGDVAQKVSKETTTVSITVNPVAGISNNVGDGQITGRFINADGNGYTGRVRFRYSPPNGRPEMLIEVGEMFAGYMSLFGLENVPFNYVLDDGTSLFGGPKSLAQIPLAPGPFPNSKQNMRVRVPNHFYESYDGGMGGTFMPAKSRMIIVGYFGPGASGKSICYLGGGADIGDGYVDVGGSTPVAWNPNTNGTALNGTWAWVDDPDGSNTTFVRGGSQESPDASGLCAPGTGTRYADFLSLNHKSLVHHDGTLAFRGPYQSAYDDGGNYRRELDVSYTSPNLNINWKYLPGVYSTETPRGLDGSEVFMRMLQPGQDPEDLYDNGGDGIPCGRLGQMGFVSLGDETIQESGADHESNITISGGLPANFDTEWAAGHVQFAVCPYSQPLMGNRVYYQSGIHYMNYGGGGMGGGGALYEVAIVGPRALTQNICSSFDVRLLDNTGNPAMPDASPISIDLATLNNYGDFYDNCGGTIINTIDVPANQNSVKVYFVGHTLGSEDLNPDLSSATVLTPKTIEIVDASTPTMLLISGTGGSMLNALLVGACVPLEISSRNSNMTPTNVGAATTVNVNAMGANLYSNVSCTVAASSVSIAASTNVIGGLYIKAATAGYVSIYADSNAPIMDGMHGLAAGVAGQPLYLGISSATTPIPANTCVQMTVSSKDATNSNVILSTSSSTPINLQAQSGGLFYAGATCVSGGTSSYSLSIAQNATTSGIVYYKQSGGGSASFQAMTNPGPNEKRGNANISMSGGSIDVYFQTATSSVSESVTPATVNVNLTSSSGSTVTVNYSVTGGTATGSGTDFTLVSGTLTFTSGQTSQPISIPIMDDVISEGNETLQLQISSPAGGGAVLGAQTTHTLTINDNEAMPVISVSDVSIAENAGPAAFVVSLDVASSTNITFDYSTTDGTATAPGDYTAITPTSGTIAAGLLTYTVNVPLNYDGANAESVEDFMLMLSNLSGNVSAGDLAGQCNISD